MSSGITCKIKLKEHLHAFYGGKHGVTVLIEKRNLFFANAIFPYLRNRKEFTDDIGTDETIYVFELPNFSSIDVRSGNWFIPQNFHGILEQILDHYFDSVYYAHMSRVDTMQEAVYDFARNYGMEITEKTYEMLKKRFYRARERDGENVKKHKKSTHNMSLKILELSSKILL